MVSSPLGAIMAATNSPKLIQRCDRRDRGEGAEVAGRDAEQNPCAPAGAQEALPGLRIGTLMCSISSVMLSTKLVIIRACLRTLITVHLVRAKERSTPWRRQPPARGPSRQR